MVTTTKTPTKRSETANVTIPEATLGPIAGALVGYAGFGILVIAASGLANALDADPGVVNREGWKELAFGAGVFMGVLLLVSFLYGGFVAGRMARTAGVPLGLFVFAAGVLMALGVAALINAGGGGEVVDRLQDSVRVFGVPGSWEEWRQVGSVAGVSSIAGMLLGSLAGARLGQRRLRPAVVFETEQRTNQE